MRGARPRRNGLPSYMKRIANWQVTLGLILIGLSAGVYYVHFLIFHDAHHIFIYLIGDIAFVFIEVLLVTLLIHRLLGYREKQAMLRKMNMVIGTFFNEVGVALLKKFKQFDRRAQDLCTVLNLCDGLPRRNITGHYQVLEKYVPDLNVSDGALSELKVFLLDKRSFLLHLLGNPNLLEHESFTDLLWAVFHLTEELHYRRGFKELSTADYEHLAKDVLRAYRRLLQAWLEYMRHLKHNYPYLFSLALRTNPFDETARVEIS